MFRILKQYFKRLESKKLLRKKKIRELETLIGNKIHDPDLFVTALTHRSVLDGKKFKESNERLEFLGDAVLGLVVAEYLYTSFPSTNEGLLTKMRANLVNKNTLFEISKKINLYQYLFIQEDLLNNHNIGIRTILADAFEALTGAVYLQFGYDSVKSFIMDNLLRENIKKGVHLIDDNFKSQLLEYVQRQKWDLPRYMVIGEEGPEHERIFTVQVAVGETVLGSGKGRNKKSAEQEAARIALERINPGLN